MPEPDFFEIFTKRLDEAGLRYMVAGAVAGIIYGEPRLTHDIDLVLELSDEGAEKISQAFPLEADVSFEILTRRFEIAQRTSC